MEQLAGKVALITGGASGIGLALAHRFASEDMKLALIDIEKPALDAAVAGLKERGITAFGFTADVASAASLAGAAEAARAALGMAHVIVNNAGVSGGTGPTWTLSEQDWAWTLGVNLWGVIHGIRTFVPPLLASGETGHVINTASIAGLTTHPWMGPYAASKHAVVAISEVLAKELELANAKIGVSVLCPGFVKTGIARSERNRPVDSGSGTPRGGGSGGLAEVMTKLVDAGVTPESIAEHVVAAIREPRFYIFTHPEMRPAIEHRQRDILERPQPGIDPMFRALLGGKTTP